MNIEGYTQHIIQKHILIIALAVIKTRPANLKYNAYIDYIKRKINENNMDSNLDITICEDDFNMSDDFTHDDDQMVNDHQNVVMNEDPFNKSNDSVTILKNFDLNDLDDPPSGKDDANSLLDVMTELNDIEENSLDQNNFTQSTNFDESQIPVNISISKTIADNICGFCENYNESKNNKVNFKEVIINANHNSNSYNNVTNIDYDDNNLTYCEINNVIKSNETNVENNNIDSQQTILYTLQGFTNNTHVSQSQEYSVIENKHLLNRSKTAFDNNIYNHNVTTKNIIENSKDELERSNIGADLVKENNNTKNVYSEQDFENHYAYNIEKIYNISTDKPNNIDNNFDPNKVYIFDRISIFNDSDGSRKHKNLENVYDNATKRIKIDVNKINKDTSSNRLEFAELSHIPEDQSEGPTKTYKINFDKNTEQELSLFSQNSDFDKAYKRTKTDIGRNSLTQEFEDNFKDLTPNLSQNGQNFSVDNLGFLFSSEEPQNLFVSIENYEPICINTSLEHINTNVRRNEKHIKPIADNNLTTKGSSENQNIIDPNFEDNSITSKDPKVFLNQTNDEMKITFNSKENCKLKERILNNLPNDEKKEVISHQNNTKECVSNNNTQKDVQMENDISENEADKETETVSFKTLEELNRVKSYLNRKDRNWLSLSEGNNSLDSGFKSSQPRSSYKSASQYSEVWINQSAHSLLSFVTDSQLSDKTTEIADEISTVLGKLVDKLHEEEKYPTFLEELLEKVNVLINDVYEGDNGEFSTLLKRDDTIYRLLLLNRSTHIIDYTIEKIIIILEKVHSDLTEDVFELKDIEKTENLSYIFHILEVILKRVKKSDELSQLSVQNSQDDDRILKKSSLTEIWRRKWNLTKSDICEGSAKKKCALTKCSEVLNRIIVKALDGYSLVAFAALQCFNLLQK